MVQLMRSGNLRPGTETATFPEKFPAKLEIDDSLEEEHGPLNKRLKSSSPFVQQTSTGSNEFPIPPIQYNPLDEPSPLGLRLRKSPSLLDLIQMRLSQGNASSFNTAPTGNLDLQGKNDIKCTAASVTADKLKASNFIASLLRIGRWEYVSRYEGDLVAKCYFAKHKLVWEILDGGLKSKIEIQWSDITALRANCPDNEPGTLIVVLARQPLFFRETNPQPRKHTLWQATADFTDGEASIHRQHFLQCPQGLLNKHYEKLIQCDVRLNFLSQQPEIALDSPYFESRGSVFEDPDEPKGYKFKQLEAAKGSPISSFLDETSLSTVPHTPQSLSTEHPSQEAPSPSSVMDLRAIEGTGSHGGDGLKGPRNWEQMKVPGLRQSLSVSDLVNHIGHCISEQMTSGNPPSEKALECQDILENIAQILLGDTQSTAASDDKSLMLRVNSLCCLLQDPATVPNSEVDKESCFEGPDEKSLMSRVNSLYRLLQDPAPVPNSQADRESHLEGLDDEYDVRCNHASDLVHEDKAEEDVGAPGGDSKNVFGCRQSQAMSRKDSFGELLLSLPRIASLPKFLFDIAEDSGESS
ncbi:hypothetical protein F0562_030435 [Nyssa sinensis]|uniref:TRF2/HOY1 PH-like domain-containing protein n=1 Tax=Nyssa sinensis TaxID=561372 RepID=A0A5J5AYA9_9ASTE|nr:hypothetical protein F0562_030435 [Nyssa sinensis]